MVFHFQSNLSLSWLWIVVILIDSIVVSNATPAFVNLPFNATWNQSGTTIARRPDGKTGTSSLALGSALGISISDDDILYVADYSNDRVLMVDMISSAVTSIGEGYGSGPRQMKNPHDVFVVGTSLYVANYDNDRIQIWSKDGTGTPAVLNIGAFSIDYFMFIDGYSNLYLCNYDQNEVVRFPAGSSSYSRVAGTGNSGSDPTELDGAQGIFVDDDLTLYIADQDNHRVQMWESGSTTGVRVAGTGYAGSSFSELNTPSAVAVDKYGFLYITDSRNNRIMRWAPPGTSGICVVGCTGSSGINANQFNWAATLAFDKYGSLFVNDFQNSRIQKFQILHNEEITTTSTTTTATSTTTTVTSTTTTLTSTTTTLTSTTTTVTSTTTTVTSTTATVTSTTTTLTSTTTTVTSTRTTLTSTTTKLTSVTPTISTVPTLTPTPTTLTTPTASTTSTIPTTPSLISITTTITSTTTTLTSTPPSNLGSVTPTATTTRNVIKFSQISDISSMSSTVSPTQTSASLATIQLTPLTSTGAAATSITSSRTLDTFSASSTVDGVRTSAVLTVTKQTSLTSIRITTEMTTRSPVTSTTFRGTATTSAMYSRTPSKQVSTHTNTLFTMSEPTRVTTIPSASNYSNVIITLSPSNPSSLSPLQVPRNTDFSISSTVEFSCVTNLAVSEQWSVSKCSNSLCSRTEPFQSSSLLQLTLSQLYIPSQRLPYGLYQMTLTVQMSSPPQSLSSVVTYVDISPSPIQVKLIEYDTTVIIQNQQQIFILDPGRFSIDPDQTSFNSTNWNYTYACRIDSLGDPQNSSCFSNRSSNQTQWSYGSNQSRSSMIIFGGSLRSNQTYEFQVKLINIDNPTRSYNGYLLVQIIDEVNMGIIIQCVHSEMCPSINEFQMINPTSQLELTSFCISNCNFSLSNLSIQWNIYYRLTNPWGSNLTQWLLLDNLTDYDNRWIFGQKSRNLTITSDLFMFYPNIQYWRIEVLYSLESVQSFGLSYFIRNSPPENGTCAINPLNGTTSTLFTITCSNWVDAHGIKDYSFYIWTTHPTDLLFLGYTTESTFQARMPIADCNSSFLNLIVNIRDEYDCITKMNIASITVTENQVDIEEFLTLIQSGVNESQRISNPFMKVLYGSGNENQICQWLISISKILNNQAEQELLTTISDDIPAVSISVSPLNEIYSVSNESPSNYTEFLNDSHRFANIRNNLIIFMNNLTITDVNSIILQATTLVRLTATTNQLTRFVLSLASTRCLNLSITLSNLANTTTYEYVQLASYQLSQCVSNILTGFNVPLQGRGILFDHDKNQSEMIISQCEQIQSMITNALKSHMNINQSTTINTSSIIMSFEKVQLDTLPNRIIRLTNNAQIKLPSTIPINGNDTSFVIRRSRLTPLAMAGATFQSNTNLSCLLSVDFLDENGNLIPVTTSIDHPFELFIPSDLNWIAPAMKLQNTSKQLFSYHFVNLTQSNPRNSISVQFEMQPSNSTVGYLLIYRFDNLPQLNSSINAIDGWTGLCPSNPNLFSYFLNNQQTLGHQTMVFAIRQFNQTEFDLYCHITTRPFHPPIIDFPLPSSIAYLYRVLTSACYYLDSTFNWQTDGLTVGPLTNHRRTQCFSTHLSTFAGGFLVLPNSINWNYVFANLDLNRNRTIYLTVIILLIIFLLLMIYSRRADHKDGEKLSIMMLTDNQLNNRYLYQMLVFTGRRKKSGTDQKVEIVLSGTSGQTDLDVLSKPNRKILQRGSIDSFLFGVPESLGALNTLRICLNNSRANRQASWFLRYIVIRDLQTMEKFYFISRQWFKAEQSNRSAEEALLAANNTEKQKYNRNITDKIYSNLFNDHLWLSVFSPLPSDSFTRVQRCTCCFVLLFLSMLLYILYYDQASQSHTDPGQHIFFIGPFAFSREQIGIGILTDLLLFLPSLFLVMFFQRIRSRRSQSQISPLLELHSRLEQIAINSTDEKPGGPQTKVKKAISFPWWCLFIAYGLSFLLISLSILFIIARGIEFGDVKVRKCLGSLAVGIFSSILLSQPIKVLALTVFFVFISRRKNYREKIVEFIDQNENFYLNGGDEFIHSPQINPTEAIDLLSVPTSIELPPDEQKIIIG